MLKPDVVVQSLNPRPWEAEAGGSLLVQAILAYIAKPVSKLKKQDPNML